MMKALLDTSVLVAAFSATTRITTPASTFS